MVEVERMVRVVRLGVEMGVVNSYVMKEREQLNFPTLCLFVNTRLIVTTVIYLFILK